MSSDNSLNDLHQQYVETANIPISSNLACEDDSSRSICRQQNPPTKNISVLYPKGNNKNQDVEIEIIEEIIIETTETQSFIYGDKQPENDRTKYKLSYGESGFYIAKDQ